MGPAQLHQSDIPPCHVLPLQATVLVSLLQPPPEVFELFDDVILMSDGRLIYHGPVPQVGWLVGGWVVKS